MLEDSELEPTRHSNLLHGLSVVQESLANQFIRLKMATRPVCLQMAVAMSVHGVVDLNCFQGLNLLDLQERLRSIWSFSSLHADIIHRHLETGMYPAQNSIVQAEFIVIHSSDSEGTRDEPSISSTYEQFIRKVARAGSGSWSREHVIDTFPWIREDDVENFPNDVVDSDDFVEASIKIMRSDVNTLGREFHNRYVASWHFCLKLAQHLKDAGFPDLESLRELSREVREEMLTSLNVFAPLQILRIHAIFQEPQEISPSAPNSNETQMPTVPSVIGPDRFTRIRTKRFTRSSLAVPAPPPPASPATAAPAPAVSDATASSAPQGTQAPIIPKQSVHLPAVPHFVAGLQIPARSRNDCKNEVYRLLRLRGHAPIQRNSRSGYIYIKCGNCRARCGVSGNVGTDWQVTVCSMETNSQCGSLANVAEPLSTCDMCGDDAVSERAAIHCNENHTLCAECFDNSVKTLLINLDNKKKFMVSPIHWCTPVACFVAV